MAKHAHLAKPFDLRAPGAIDQLLAFHHALVGDARMEEAGGDGGSGGQGGDGGSGGDGGGQGANDLGFPKDTPWRDMKPDEQVAYWQHQARKHEGTSKARADYEAIKAERDQLKTANQSDAEKAVEQAKKDAAAAAKTEARNEFAPKLVAAKLEAALAGKLSADKIAEHVEFLDHAKFLTDTGEVDTDKVKNYAAGLAPAGGQWPDTGQGRRGDAGGTTKAEAGKAEAQKRFGDKS